MTTAGVNEGHARGCAVNKVPNGWHAGSLPGTTPIMVHGAAEMCWAGLRNGRTGAGGGALDRRMWKIGREVKACALQGSPIHNP